jgi:hypothetical protein
LDDVRQAAEWLLERYPDRAAGLVRRWLGQRADYGKV